MTTSEPGHPATPYGDAGAREPTELASRNIVSHCNDASCHLVHVRVWRLVFKTRRSFSCQTLDDVQLDAVRHLIESNRDEIALAGELDAMCARNGMSPIAILYTHAQRRELPVPGAFYAPFEPVPLDETHETVYQIQTASIRAEELPRVSPWNRLRAKVGDPFSKIFGVLLVLPILPAVGYLLMSLRTWPARLALLAVACGIIILLLDRFRALPWQGNWLLVPGGVVVGSARRPSGPEGSKVFTPANSLLTISPIPLGWLARVTSRARFETARLTNVEAVALLAIWQSPCAPPNPALLERIAQRD